MKTFLSMQLQPACNAMVPDAMEEALPEGFIRNSEFPHWFSTSSKYYI
jgi:hypothetical protein